MILTRADASIGLLLKGKPDHSFEAVAPAESGFVVPYDVKDMEVIKVGKQKAVLVTCNDAALRLFAIK